MKNFQSYSTPSIKHLPRYQSYIYYKPFYSRRKYIENMRKNTSAALVKMLMRLRRVPPKYPDDPEYMRDLDAFNERLLKINPFCVITNDPRGRVIP